MILIIYFPGNSHNEKQLQLNGHSAWSNRGKPIDWPFESSTLASHLRQISQDIVNDEWRNISSEAVKPFIFTLPLQKYVLAKGGQPLRAMVSSRPKMDIL